MCLGNCGSALTMRNKMRACGLSHTVQGGCEPPGTAEESMPAPSLSQNGGTRKLRNRCVTLHAAERRHNAAPTPL